MTIRVVHDFKRKYNVNLLFVVVENELRIINPLIRKHTMKKLYLLLFLFLPIISYSQSDHNQVKLDSIIKEADMLYNYERAAWVSTDIIMPMEKLRENYGGYIVYHSNDTIYATIMDQSQRNRVARFTFVTSNMDDPVSSNFKTSELTEKEMNLFIIKSRVISQLSNPKYEIGIPEGFSPNLILLEEDDGYKLYIIMGTSESGIIPFGNDYIFYTDSTGNITSWRKFHSTLIPVQSTMSAGEVLRSAMHSHLKTTPYITATDICTFRLYAPFTELNEFKVLSTALKVYMKYDLATNSIEILEM